MNMREQMIATDFLKSASAGGWWQTARSLDLSISEAFDQLDPINWLDFGGGVADELKHAACSGNASLFDAYLGTIGLLIGMAERFGADAARNWGSR
ncbi:MAG: hypothetical protein JSS21_12660 [Proteobacteria bacterium]|nr:hypothetical protein [Pseudomonadota bacterium]